MIRVLLDLETGSRLPLVVADPAVPRDEAVLVSRDPATGRVVDAVRVRLPGDPE